MDYYKENQSIILELDVPELDLKKICRICASLFPTESFLTSIPNDYDDYDDDDTCNQVDLAFKIRKYLSVEITSNSDVRFKVCINCIQNILSWDKFYKNCQNINDKFKLIFGNKLPENQIDIASSSGNTEQRGNSYEEGDDSCDVSKYGIRNYGNQRNENNKECNHWEQSGNQSPSSQKTRSHNVKVFHCDICDETKSIDFLLSHMTSHAIELQQQQQLQHSNQSSSSSNVSQMKCPKCEEEFENFEEVQTHLHSIHMKIYDFEETEEEFHDDDNNECNNDESNDTINNDLDGASDILNYNEKMFHCDICDETKSIDVLLSHMASHALELQQKSSNTLSSTTTPLTQNSQIKCSKCDKAFKNLKSVTFHIRTVHIKKCNFHCKFCNKSFTCNRLLMNHIKSIHNSNERNYKCEICSKSFKIDSTFYMHKKLHEQKLFECDKCNKLFRYKHQLKNHLIVIHTNDRNYECKLCKKKFSTQNNLKKHQDTHSNSLDFKCHICGIQMKLKRYVNHHINRVHRAVFSKKNKS